MTDLVHLRTDRGALEAKIREAGSTIRGDNCTCPHPDHEDNHPSASIHAGSDGVWRVTCHSRDCFGRGADLFDLEAALTGRPLADVLREASGGATGGQASKTHSGHPAASNVTPAELLALARQCHEAITGEQLATLADGLGVSVDSLRRLRVGWHADKGVWTFPMRNADGNVVGIRTRTPEGRKFAITGSVNALFIAKGLTGDGTLYVVEGPTDTVALLDMGFDAIGRPSNTTGEDHIVAFVGRRRYRQVVIVTDRDSDPNTAAATTQHAEKLAQRIMRLVGSVRIIQPPEGYKDVRAWRQAGAGADDIEALADQAEARGPAGELRAMIEAEIDGTRRAIAWPWRLVTRGTQALIPGTVTLLVGDPGSGKSLWLIEALAYWHGEGIPVAIFQLEQSRADHLKRALAQRVGASWLTDLESVATRPDEARAYHAEHAGWLDDFGRRIYEVPDKPVKLAELVAWIEARAREGARIIAIDPVTAAETSDRPWDDAQKFLHTVMPILDRAGASLVLVTHPRKGKQRATASTLDDLAGGAAWQRFSQCVLWLERHDEPKAVTVKTFGFPVPQDAEINRTLRIMKARNGRGAGWQLGIAFDPQTLRFDERGAIVKANAYAEDNR